jgi:DNA-binding Xre family transcriptional regulator
VEDSPIEKAPIQSVWNNFVSITLQIFILAPKIYCMLYIDIQKACSNKGVSDPRKFLLSIGFSHAATSRMLNNTYESLKFEAVEQICLHLNCTPNELMSWKPKDNANATNHALDKLKPIAAQDSITGKLKRLSPDKLEKLRDFLGDLENE